MQKTNLSFLNIIIKTCTELDDTFENYCAGNWCSDCDFGDFEKNCRYKTNLLMLLNGYRMATKDPAEKAQIDAFLKENYPSFLAELYKQI